jgi:hypothetical protein
MTQLDPRIPRKTSPPTHGAGASPQMQEPAFNWRVSVGIAIGLVVLFGALFGLRALHIFPPEPGQDPEIVAARATQAALQTQAVLAPKPTTATVAAPAAAPTANPAAVVTPAPIPTRAPTPPATQQSVAASQAATAATVSQTAGAPVGTSPTVQSTAEPTTVPSLGSSAVATPTALANAISTAGAPTPAAVNLPADLANAILEGYSNYWTVRLNAMRDPSDMSIDLQSVMAGNELIGAQKTLSQYRDAGEAFDTNVKHSVWITKASSDAAVIVDEFTSTARKVDPDTKAPIEASASVENRTDTFELRRIDGTWKVVDEP